MHRKDLIKKREQYATLLDNFSTPKNKQILRNLKGNHIENYGKCYACEDLK